MEFNYDAYKAGMAIPNRKTREQEFMDKQRLLEAQANLENQSLSAEEKLFRLMQQQPDEFRKFMELKNMMTPYQQGMLGIQRGQLGIQGAKLGEDRMTPQQKNYQFLIKQGVPPKEAMERVGLKAEEVIQF